MKLSFEFVMATLGGCNKDIWGSNILDQRITIKSMKLNMIQQCENWVELRIFFFFGANKWAEKQ